MIHIYDTAPYIAELPNYASALLYICRLMQKCRKCRKIRHKPGKQYLGKEHKKYEKHMLKYKI
jgi:hypothetical protein